MSKVNLDLKMFKHVKSDGKSTTLQHKDGHQLILAHGALGPEAQEQLKALSKVSGQASKPTDKAEAKQDTQMLANGGTTMAYQDQLKVEQPGTQPKEPQPYKPPQSKTKYEDKPNKGMGGIKHKMYADETDGLISPNDSAPVALLPDAPDPAGQAMQDLNKAVAAVPPDPISPDIRAKRQIYNQLATPSLGPKSVFTDDNTPPPNFNSGLWEQAERTYKAYQKQDMRTAEQQGAQEALKNKALASAGVAPTPSLPTAPISTPNASGQAPVPSTAPDQGQAGGASALPDAMDPSAGILSGYNTQMRGIDKAANAAGALGEQQAIQHQKAAEAQQTAQDAFHQSFQTLENERQAHIKDIQDGLINPDKYWTGDPQTGEGGHSKIAAGIGMIIAGFNPTAQPNAAVNFLKYQMDKNIEAQKQNLGAKQNLLAANLKQFGNVQDATAMTRIMQNDVVGHMLDANAAKAQGGPNGLAAAAAMQAKGPLMRESAQLQFQMGLRHMMTKLSGGQSGDPSNTASAEQAVAMMGQMPGMQEQAKQYRSQLVPTVGFSPSQSVPDAARQKFVGHQKLQAGLADLANFVNTHSTKLGNPLDPDFVTGEAKVRKLQSEIREGVLGTVYREGEQPLLDKFLKGNPAGLLKDSVTVPQLKELMGSNFRDYELLRRSFGMAPLQAPQQQESAAPVMGKDGNQYKQIMHGGKSYYVPINIASGK